MWILFPAVVAYDPACALKWHSDPSAATVINHDVEVWLEIADNVLVAAFADTTVVADEVVAVVVADNVVVAAVVVVATELVAAAAAEATVAVATVIAGFAGESEIVVVAAFVTEHVDGVSVAAGAVVVFADVRAWL